MERIPVYTIGYSGLTPGQFLRRLKGAGVQVLVDVRERPLSRKRGFSKLGLQEYLQKHGIEYVHLQELGVPADLRTELRNGTSLAEYLNAFRRYLKGKEGNDALEVLYRMAQEQPCCMMCVEQDPTQCHRSVVAECLYLHNGSKLGVQHL